MTNPFTNTCDCRGCTIRPVDTHHFEDAEGRHWKFCPRCAINVLWHLCPAVKSERFEFAIGSIKECK